MSNAGSSRLEADHLPSAPLDHILRWLVALIALLLSIIGYLLVHPVGLH